MARCVNLDWLEVFLIEPNDVIPHDADFFESRGYHVKRREYGTPQYKEMFTIYTPSSGGAYEIRRNPYSLKSEGGIFEKGACHLRFTNRECYNHTAIDDLRKFLITFSYKFKGITRADICLDFNQFENGESPNLFCQQYMAGKYHKIGLSRVHVYGYDFREDEIIVKDEKGRILKNPTIYRNGHIIAAHGTDKLYRTFFNSLKWGSPSSAVNTKLYNKSMELQEQKMKFHIVDAWEAAGLDTNRDVWRLEFSVSTDAKDWLCDGTGETFRLSLDNLRTPGDLNFVLNNLIARYFRFTIASYNRNGKPQRKDRCEEYKPFDLTQSEVFKPVRLTENIEPDRVDKMLVKRLRSIAENKIKPKATKSEREAARELLYYFHIHRRFAADLMSRLL